MKNTDDSISEAVPEITPKRSISVTPIVIFKQTHTSVRIASNKVLAAGEKLWNLCLEVLMVTLKS
ncbi:MAG: hypothetical protein Kapaf2KO_20360 [Candidatus Kapaibacteriales bacterium]